jgi:hypothetical protein
MCSLQARPVSRECLSCPELVEGKGWLQSAQILCPESHGFILLRARSKPRSDSFKLEGSLPPVDSATEVASSRPGSHQFRTKRSKSSETLPLILARASLLLPSRGCKMIDFHDRTRNNSFVSEQKIAL